MTNVLLQAMSRRKQHYAVSVNNREELETSRETTASAHSTFCIWYLTMTIFSDFRTGFNIVYEIISFCSEKHLQALPMHCLEFHCFIFIRLLTTPFGYCKTDTKLLWIFKAIWVYLPTDKLRYYYCIPRRYRILISRAGHCVGRVRLL